MQTPKFLPFVIYYIVFITYLTQALPGPKTDILVKRVAFPHVNLVGRGNGSKQGSYNRGSDGSVNLNANSGCVTSRSPDGTVTTTSFNGESCVTRYSDGTTVTSGRSPEQEPLNSPLETMLNILAPGLSILETLVELGMIPRMEKRQDDVSLAYAQTKDRMIACSSVSSAIMNIDPQITSNAEIAGILQSKIDEVGKAANAFYQLQITQQDAGDPYGVAAQYGECYNAALAAQTEINTAMQQFPVY